MPFHQPESVRYYTFDLFAGEAITHAVFTRVGGVSKDQWTSLNVGLTVGDDPACVAENRRLSFQTAERSLETLSDSWLVHGTDVFIYEAPKPLDQPFPPKADIILTDNPEVTLFMRYADCAPILLFDPVEQVIGLAHSGWLGTVKKVGQVAVEAMRSRFGCAPANILAAIGPTIGPNQYEVGADIVEAVKSAFGNDSESLLPRINHTVHFDLWEANLLVLEQGGVGQIELSGICTADNPQDWFSHRASQGKTGRFGVLLALNGKRKENHSR
jgi:YfiH family protein